MNKRFRCGRLMITKNGKLKKLTLLNGGGSRYCDWDSDNMTFNDVHYRLLKIFDLRGFKHKTTLCNFQGDPINIKRYGTFEKYFKEQGLNGNATVVYLCTREVDGLEESRISMTNKRNSFSIQPSHSSTVQQQSFTQSKTNSFRGSIGYRHVVTNELYSNQSLVHPSSLDYSFQNSSSDLMNNIRALINENSFDVILIQIFEYICIIHGYVSSTIEPLIQQMKQSNEYLKSMNQSEIKLYSNNLNNIYDICQSIQTLIDENKYKFGRIRIFSTIINSFAHFYEHLKTLKNQWLENVENNNNTFNIASISSSFTRSTIESISSHSYQTPSSSNVFPRLSSVRELSGARTNEQNSLFQPVLSYLRYLLKLLNPKRLSSFREFLESSIDKIKSVRTSINLNNEQSICDGKRVILFIKNQLIKKSDKLKNKQSKGDLDRQIDESCKRTLGPIKLLFLSLDRYQMATLKHSEQDDSN